MKLLTNSVVSRFFPLLLWGAFIVLCLWKFEVSFVRFFDVDEFTHLHWATNIVRLDKPYVDFMTFFTPGYYWFLGPFIKFFWMDPQIFVAMRMVSFVIFLLLAGAIGILFGLTRSWRWALLPMVLLAFLPMPYDKFLEIRPDNLATLLAIGGMIAQILAIKTARRYAWLVSGVCYGVSLIVLVKMLPFAGVGAGVALLGFMWNDGKKEYDRLLFFALGLILPWIGFLLWILLFNDWNAAWYSLAVLPFEANKMGLRSIMEPHLFFFPNASFYGGTGITSGLLLNHAIWVIGIIVGVVRFFTPFTTAQGDRKNVLVEILISGIFLLSVVGYIEFFPLKHAQYLIPIALFIVYYASDVMMWWLEAMRISMRAAVLIGGICVLLFVARQIQQMKLEWSNTAQLTQAQTLLSSIPANVPVVDLEGRMLFWKDAYYICCVPFGAFEEYVSRRPSPLREELEKKAIPYIWQGETGRMEMLSFEDQTYIKAHYEPVTGWSNALWMRLPQQ